MDSSLYKYKALEMTVQKSIIIRSSRQAESVLGTLNCLEHEKIMI